METGRKSSASSGSILPGSQSPSLVHGGSSDERGSVAGQTRSALWRRPGGTGRSGRRDAPYGQPGGAPVSVQAPKDPFGSRDLEAEPPVPEITSADRRTQGTPSPRGHGPGTDFIAVVKRLQV